MRPRPSEIITGIRAILAETVLPELTSEHARSRLVEVRAVLAQVDWDDAAFDLKARGTALAGALGDAADWVDIALPEPPVAETFAAYQDFWEQLATAATATIERLDAHLDLHPGDDRAKSIRVGLVAAV